MASELARSSAETETDSDNYGLVVSSRLVHGLREALVGPVAGTTNAGHGSVVAPDWVGWLQGSRAPVVSSPLCFPSNVSQRDMADDSTDGQYEQKNSISLLRRISLVDRISNMKTRVNIQRPETVLERSTGIPGKPPCLSHLHPLLHLPACTSLLAPPVPAQHELNHVKANVSYRVLQTSPNSLNSQARPSRH